MSVYAADELQFVKQAVESVLQQSFANYDFYILADGVVRDDVEQYLGSVNDERLHFRLRQQNVGLAKSLNELLGIVLPLKYTYIARMDADDVALPMRFEKQLLYLENHADIDCVGSWAIEIDANGNEYFRKQMPQTHDECRSFFKKRDCMIHPTVVFRNTYFEKAGLYPEDTYFGEDTMMWANGFANGCKFANLPEYLYLFRLNEQFFSRRRGWKHAKSIYQLRHRVNKLLHYGFTAELYAIMYAMAKMLPTKLLDIVYKTAR